MAKTRTGPVTLLGVIAALCFVLGPLLAHFWIVPALAGFALFALGGLLGIVTVIVAAVVAVRRGLSTAGIGLGLGVVITAVFVLSAMPGRKVPRINDITTDPTRPPQFVKAGSLPANQGRNMQYPAAFAEQQRAGYPDLGPLALAMSPDEAFKRVETTAKQTPDWQVIRIDASARALEGVSTSRLFHFRDDFVIEVRPRDGGSVVQMRSKSRDGKGDVGANAARIKAFFEKLK